MKLEGDLLAYFINSAKGCALLWQFNERIFVFIFWIGFLVFLLFILDGENGVAFGFRDDEQQKNRGHA